MGIYLRRYDLSFSPPSSSHELNIGCLRLAFIQTTRMFGVVGDEVSTDWKPNAIKGRKVSRMNFNEVPWTPHGPSDETVLAQARLNDVIERLQRFAAAYGRGDDEIEWVKKCTPEAYMMESPYTKNSFLRSLENDCATISPGPLIGITDKDIDRFGSARYTYRKEAKAYSKD